MFVVGGLIVGNPKDTRESIEANLDFARERVDWPYIQHPTPYPGTPMTKDFRERGLIVNDRLEEYDGTTAVVRTEHLPADEIEFMRWRAERWMKLRHFWPTLTHSPLFVLRHGPADAAPHVPGQLLAFHSRPRNRAGGLRAISIDQTAGARQLHLTIVTAVSTVTVDCRLSTATVDCDCRLRLPTATVDCDCRPRLSTATADHRPPTVD